MPVDTTCPEYDSMIDKWSRSRDVVEGTDAIKDKGIKYLPRLSGQPTAEYTAYLTRAYFYGATYRTVQGLLGAVFRIEPSMEYVDRYSDHTEALTSKNVSANAFAKGVVEEILTVGRCGVLVEVPLQGDTRAYTALYRAEDIINWRTELVDGKMVLTKVVLREEYERQDPDDPFMFEPALQYRVLMLTEGVYEFEVYRKAQESDMVWVKEEDLSGTPVRSGKRLDFIPFQFINAYDLTADVQKPPLLDLTDTNLSHYRSSADYEHGAHYTALPTAVLTGFDPKMSYDIGSGAAWVTSNSDAKATFLEFRGQGLGALRDLIGDKEKRMAVLGARMLEEQKKAAETSETLRLRQSGEEGALTTIAVTSSEGLQQVLRWVAWWSGASDAQVDSITYDLNNDFVSQRMAPQEITALMQAHQSGEISQDTFLHNLKQGEILPPGRTVDEEIEMIAAEGDEFATVEPAQLKLVPEQ